MTTDTLTELEQKVKVRSAIAELIEFMNTASVEHYAKHFPSLEPATYTQDGGRKYLRIMAPGHVHCFVGALTGDVYMAATINKPMLNGARYNLFDEESYAKLKRNWDPHGGYLYKGRQN
jgi:hypothetical protein